MALKIAIDLDGTAFAWPNELGRLAVTLQDALADVFFLTAAAGELPPSERPAEVERRVSQRLGCAVSVKIPVVCCEEREKAQKLRDLGVHIVIDDRPIEGWNGLQLVPLKK